jgi:hypothetical protein
MSQTNQITRNTIGSSSRQWFVSHTTNSYTFIALRRKYHRTFLRSA